MPSIINTDNGLVSGSAGLKITAAGDGELEIQSSGNTIAKVTSNALTIPTGNTLQRPASPVNGMIRFNNETGELEAYVNGGWKGVAGTEPALKLDFDQYQFDSRISFTRATNGTYFDSAGVLQTAGSGVARFDHRLEGGMWVNKGLLIEEQRTNICIRSEELDNAAWTKVAVAVTQNSTTAPDGNTTAEKVADNSTNTQHNIQSTAMTITGGATVTASCFLKLDPANTSWDTVWIQVNNTAFGSGFRCRPNLSNGTFGSGGTTFGTGAVVSQSVQDVGNGWYRFTVTGTVDASSTSIQLVLFANNGLTYVGSGNAFFAWGAQLEVGVFPTSYIKTTSASVTRNADIVQMTGTNFSSWFNSAEGTVFWQGDMVGVSGGNLFAGWEISNNTIAERLLLVTQNATGLISTFLVRDDNVDVGTVVSPDPRITAVPNQAYKTASAYKLNDLAHTLDGRVPGTDTSVTMPTPNMLRLGAGNEAGTSVYFLNGHIAKFYYWPNRLPNAKLQSLTQ